MNFAYLFSGQPIFYQTTLIVDFGAFIYKQATDWYDKYKIDSKFYINHFDCESCKPLEISMWPHWVDNVNFKHFKNL
jgi:hypothetical protein